jgi:hypothetical protein
MALDSTQVRAGITGTISVAPATATAPTDADDVLDTDFADLGYVSDDGVTEKRDRSSDTIKGWQNGDVVRELVTEANLTYEFTLLQTNPDTVGLYYGAAVDPADGSLTVVPAATGGRKSYVLDVVDGDELIRTYVPQGEITEVGDMVYANGEAIGYHVTVRAYTDSTLGGAARKWYASLASS